MTAVARSLGEGLESLSLRDVYCKGAGAAALSESAGLASLRHLDLAGNRIDTDGARRLAAADLPHLEALDMSGPSINPYYWSIGQQPLLDAGAIAWVERPRPALRELRLANTFLTEETLTALLNAPGLDDLRTLELSHNSFTLKEVEASPGSPRWDRLEHLGLSDCRLDDAAIEALAAVPEAPSLRSLTLGYNSIGPVGARALANWPVLGNLWHLDLHDNFIGDAGLIALAESPYAGRLLELDLEQDCWNTRTFDFSDTAARALADSTTLGRLEAAFSGCVDEYHGCGYSPGFTREGLDLIRSSPRLRPTVRAALGDFSGVSEYIEQGPLALDRELDDHDFRGGVPKLVESEADVTQPGRLQQVKLPGAGDDRRQRSPRVSPLRDLAEEDDAAIEGLEHRDPRPGGRSCFLYLKLDDDQRPLPGQVGKLLADTLNSALRAAKAGHLEVGGSHSTTNERGESVELEVVFYVGLAGDGEQGLQLIREALWWVGAPGGTRFREDDLKLALPTAPDVAASRLVQLARLTAYRWGKGRKNHRFDRVRLSPEQKGPVSSVLGEATDTGSGWKSLTTDDGGRLSVWTRHLDADDATTIDLSIDLLTPEVSRLIHRLTGDTDLQLLPMALVASDTTPRPDVDWPVFDVVDADRLHALLSAGPYARWAAQAE